jgi:hypothetical protein
VIAQPNAAPTSARNFVADDIAQGRLACWGTHAGPPVEIWALQSSRRLIGAKVRAFLDVLDKTFPEKVFVPSI